MRKWIQLKEAFLGYIADRINAIAGPPPNHDSSLYYWHSPDGSRHGPFFSPGEAAEFFQNPDNVRGDKYWRLTDSNRAPDWDNG